MAILTPLELDDAKKLGRRYGREIASMKGLLAGSVNSNFALTTTSGERLFLRVYEEQSVDTATREAGLLASLARAGVPTPEPLPLREHSAARGVAPSYDAGFIAEHRGKAVALFPFLDGEILCQKRVTESAAADVGAALARVHLAGKDGSLSKDVGRTRFDRASLEARLQGLPPNVSEEISQARERLLLVFASPPPPTTFGGVIHGDLFRDNVLFREGRIVALLDFESASVGSFAFDLMVTILSWCFGDDLERGPASSMTRAYLATMKPTTEESEAFRRDLYPQALFACARFATTRITDFELRPKGTGIYKDFRRFLARMDTILRLGPEGLLEFVGL